MNGSGRLRLNRSDGRRDRDDDLLLFRELFKHEEQHNVNLLDPVSVDIENAPGNQLYRIPSAKKGGGYDFISLDGEKNDFDWLKTPPATPLFPSLEMEATNNPNKMFFKEAPKPSRFAAIQEEPKPPISPGSRSASSQSDSASSHSEIPNRRSSSSLGGSVSGFTLKEALNLKHKPTKSFSNHIKRPNTTSTTTTTTTTTTNNNNSNASSKPLSSSSTSIPKKHSLDSKPRSRGVSPPVVRSRIPAMLPDFADQAPPNLITTGRAVSASRGRLWNQSADAKIEAGKARRQSCSPGATRRRPAEFGSSEEGRVHQSTGGNFVMGSRMVEKMMNARRSASAAEEIISSRQRQKQRGTGVGEDLMSSGTKLRGDGVTNNEMGLRPKPRGMMAAGAAKDVAGYGRLMTRSSLDVAFQHMEIRKTSNDNVSMSRMKTITPVSSSATSHTDPGLRSTTSVDDARNPMSRRMAENKSLIKKAEARKRCGLC